MDGILIIDKPKGMTSRDVVNKVSKILGTKKIGHTGTLDPIATGVLVLCINKATKLVDVITEENKEYIATALLGVETDTLDNTGNILKEEICKFTKEQIIDVLNSFKGEYNQKVPLYSAVKINGKKLYEYARENIKINLPSRLVTIESIELIDDIKIISGKVEFKFKCTVSKGTYIRSLIKDIAVKLNTVGIMTDLRRVRQGIFKIEDAINISNVKKDKIIKIKDVLNFKQVEIDKSIEKRVLNGAVVDNIYGCKEILFLKDGVEIALYKEDENKLGKLKISKMFKGGNL